MDLTSFRFRYPEFGYAQPFLQKFGFLGWMGDFLRGVKSPRCRVIEWALHSDAKQMSRRGRCVAYSSDYGAEYKVKTPHCSFFIYIIFSYVYYLKLLLRIIAAFVYLHNFFWYFSTCSNLFPYFFPSSIFFWSTIRWLGLSSLPWHFWFVSDFVYFCFYLCIFGIV